ncbi:DUF397 domain-containing protein [Solihabitans fulvus]|uniref:DUF397 domain-containing protein n=1 Tax=Solihabitans fulvus TaxID=1892852 RepID=A0A5B2XP44_9PSEU|nr:DUF397 domain-containing protein [Solihabitans fulvus]KAA2264671.1 DUF397 domain-containing protein [Solihabitans fulvus]
MSQNLSNIVWRKSSRSGQDGGNCVEIGFAGTRVGVRDSKNADGPALVFPERGWTAFLASGKAGSFDLG